MADASGKLSDLPQLRRLVTTHNEDGKAIAKADDFEWKPFDDAAMAFSVVYTTSEQPVNLNNESDINAHCKVMKEGKLGLVNPGGTVIRCVDFKPGYSCAMHRTQSLDYGIVLEGDVDMVLDSGEVYQMKRGDVAIQRATQHQWRNRSQTEWARMMFVLQDCKPMTVDGKIVVEDLGDTGGLPASKLRSKY